MIIELIVAGALAGQPRISFEFGTDTAKPGDQVAVRAAGLPSRRALRLYFVRSSLRTRIRSAEDARLAFIGTLRPRARRAATTFTVPPLDSGTYVPWCPGCGGRVTGALRVTMPIAPLDACPATIPSSGPPPGLKGRYHGNGAIWTPQPADGVWIPPSQNVQPDGSIGTKLFWFADGIDGVFALSGRRLDAPSPPLRVHTVNRGTMSGFRGTGTWATVVTFPTRGCWRLTARVRDLQRRVAVNLSFVLDVRVESR